MLITINSSYQSIHFTTSCLRIFKRILEQTNKRIFWYWNYYFWTLVGTKPITSTVPIISHGLTTFTLYHLQLHSPCSVLQYYMLQCNFWKQNISCLYHMHFLLFQFPCCEGFIPILSGYTIPVSLIINSNMRRICML